MASASQREYRPHVPDLVEFDPVPELAGLQQATAHQGSR
jgi:hypothetical protein